MRKLHEPLTLPKHGGLLSEINQAIIDIKIQDDEKPMMLEAEMLEKLRKDHKKHSLQDIVQLLQKCYKAIDEQREDPRKY